MLQRLRQSRRRITFGPTELLLFRRNDPFRRSSSPIICFCFERCVISVYIYQECVQVCLNEVRARLVLSPSVYFSRFGCCCSRGVLSSSTTVFSVFAQLARLGGISPQRRHWEGGSINTRLPIRRATSQRGAPYVVFLSALSVGGCQLNAASGRRRIPVPRDPIIGLLITNLRLRAHWTRYGFPADSNSCFSSLTTLSIRPHLLRPNVRAFFVNKVGLRVWC